MAGNIKGITIEFNGDTTKLDKALRGVDKQTKGIDKELRAVNKDLKFNPKSVELWQQKQQLLTQKIDATKSKLDVLKQAQKQMDADGIDKNSEQYRKLQREIIESESKLKHFTAEQKKIAAQLSPLGQFSTKMKDVGSSLEKAGQSMKGLSIAAAAVVAALGAITVKAAKNADDINTMSKVYGIGTADLQKYSLAADQVDVSVDTIAKSHIKLKKQMASAQEGTGAAAEAFEQLGVEVTNADGTLKNGDQTWQEVIQALSKVENETERDALAMQLMGKSAAELNPLIEDGGKTYERLGQLFEKYDLEYVDQQTLDQANALNDSLDDIKSITDLTIQTVGANLSAVLAPVLEKIVDLVGRVAGWLANLDPRVLAIIGGIASLVAVLAPLLIGLGKIAFAISSISGLAATMGVTIGALAGPIGIAMAIIAALVAIGVVLYRNWDTIKAKALDLKNKIVAAWDSLKSNTVAKFNAIKDAIVRPFKTAIEFVKSGIEKIKSIINGAKLALPKFKLPHFKISGGKLPWGIGGEGKAPSINVDWYKTGAIFDAPSIIGVGEAGREAVVPLSGEAMRPFAEAIASEMAGYMTTLVSLGNQRGGSQTIHNVIELGGTKVAEQIFKLAEQGRAAMQG